MPCVDAPLVCAVPCAVALMACVCNCVTPLAGYVCFVTLAVVFVLVMCVQCIGQSSRCDGWFPLYLCVCFVAATSRFVLVLQMQRAGQPHQRRLPCLRLVRLSDTRCRNARSADVHEAAMSSIIMSRSSYFLVEHL